MGVFSVEKKVLFANIIYFKKSISQGGGICTQWIRFSLTRPLGQVSLVVAMSVFIYVYLYIYMPRPHVIFLKEIIKKCLWVIYCQLIMINIQRRSSSPLIIFIQSLDASINYNLNFKYRELLFMKDYCSGAVLLHCPRLHCKDLH